MSNIKKILFPLVAVVLSLTACTWNEAENLDFTQNHLSPEEADPEGYALYLQDLRDYRASEHLVTIAGVEAVSEMPIRQSQHLVALPDSVDIVWLKNITTIHPVILKEMDELREKKAQIFLGDVNLDTYMAAWSQMQDKKEEDGQKPGTEEEYLAYVVEQTKADLAKCLEFKLDGIVFTANGTSNKIQEAFIKTIKDWHAQNGYLTFIFRGSVKNISDLTVLNFCKYTVVICDEGTTTATGISSRMRLILGNDKKVPHDRAIIEVSVPDSEVPEQVGAPASSAAEWAFDNKASRKVKSCGILINNADDDYYRADLIYRNVRTAISYMTNGPVEN